MIWKPLVAALIWTFPIGAVSAQSQPHELDSIVITITGDKHHTIPLQKWRTLSRSPRSAAALDSILALAYRIGFFSGPTNLSDSPSLCPQPDPLAMLTAIGMYWPGGSRTVERSQSCTGADTAAVAHLQALDALKRTVVAAIPRRTF